MTKYLRGRGWGNQEFSKETTILPFQTYSMEGERQFNFKNIPGVKKGVDDQ
jgi:hypothetical protein